MTVPATGKTNVVSNFIGCQRLLPCHDGTNAASFLHVVTRPEAVDLKDVAITGIYRRTKESFTGSPSTSRGSGPRASAHKACCKAQEPPARRGYSATGLADYQEAAPSFANNYPDGGKSRYSESVKHAASFYPMAATLTTTASAHYYIKNTDPLPGRHHHPRLYGRCG